MLNTVQFCMSAHYYSALTEWTVATTFEVHLRIVTELHTVVIIQPHTRKFTVAHRVSPTINTDLTLTITDALDVGIKVQANSRLPHGN